MFRGSAAHDAFRDEHNADRLRPVFPAELPVHPNLHVRSENGLSSGGGGDFTVTDRNLNLQMGSHQDVHHTNQ